MEDMLYEVESVRTVRRVEAVGPAAGSRRRYLNFRHLLEEHELGQSLNRGDKPSSGVPGSLRLREGTIVDAEHHRGAVIDEESCG